MSVLPVESDTARVSALPVVGIEVPAVYFGKVALDSVGLRVGLSCFRLDPEETRPALLDERGVTSGPMEWAPVLEPLEHSVLEKSLDGGFTEGVPVLEPLEHSFLGETPDGGHMVGALVLESIEHSVPEKALDYRSMPYGWRHGTLAGRFGLALGRKWLYAVTDCVVLFSYLAGRRFRLRVISDVLEVSQGHVLLTCTLGYRPPRLK